MRILHLMRGKEKFTKGTVDLYNEEFDHAEHEICYLMKMGQESCIRDDNSIKQHEVYLKQNSLGQIQFCLDVLSLMRKYDYVVMHSFCLEGFLTLYLFFNNKFCRKHLIWIEWGADLYDFQIQDNPGLKKRIMFYIGEKVRNNVNSVICIFPPDCDYYKKEYQKSKARVFYAPYISGKTYRRNYEYIPSKSRLKETKEKGETIYIQIGHNAQKQLNHLKALELLSKFNNENIMLVLPLSYSSDHLYINQITQLLERFFPGKYIVLKNFMPEEEYFKIVSRIDIAIFYTYRQTGLGNINEMINNNVKLFMPEGSVMKEYFSSIGIPISSIESIRNMSFDEFSSTIEWEEINGPQKYIENLNNYDSRINYWENIYEELRQ